MNHHSIVNKMNYSEEFKDMIGALLTHIHKLCFGCTLLRSTENSADRYEIGCVHSFKVLKFSMEIPIYLPMSFCRWALIGVHKCTGYQSYSKDYLGQSKTSIFTSL